MLVYVEWKINLENPNKVNILRIRQEKDPTIEYTIATYKFLLGKVKLNDNFNQDQVFFTRVNIGNIKDNTVKILVCDEITKKQNTNEEPYEQLLIFMIGSPICMTSQIKAIHRVNLFLDENYLPIVPENDIDKELNKFVKEIKKNKIQTTIDKYGNPYTLYVSELNVE